MLTDRRIKHAAPPPGAREINLRDEPGLVLRVRRNSNGELSHTWAFWRQASGKRSKVMLGKWPAVTVTEARRKAEHARRLADAGVRVTTRAAIAGAAIFLGLALVILGETRQQREVPVESMPGE